MSWGTYIQNLWSGLKLTFQHLSKLNKRKPVVSIQNSQYFQQADGLVTIKYPKEHLPVPDIGRYQLHLDIEDCIGCDQCARICPVNCIEIETIRSVQDLGMTSDGTPKKFYLPKFDIDMAKCCYCGLCTVVCPTECLIMLKEYDYAAVNIQELNFHWNDITPEQAEEKRKEWEAYELAKKEAKLNASKSQGENLAHKENSGSKKPILKLKSSIHPKDEKNNQ